uniref:uncharacterized protein LOC120341553 n=1 Tax=Styela clava TaxID=7725 RepID=UPI00193A0C37|nr:uncharacterized protein LOC120341553 [Styela clava]
MSSKSKEAISIASVTEDGKFFLNVDNVNVLLDILADKEDVAIISMVGAYRTGKSFMLNIFLQYLRKKGWQNENWLGPEDKKLQDGFYCGRGSMRLTRGINVCPEIFDVPLENGKEISVMIVDTQGLFDFHSTQDTNHKIMMMSTILSSHQIFNCVGMLQQRDLEFFHTSVRFAKTITQMLQKKEEHPFQALTFLVRDCHFDYEYPLGDKGGCEYVGSILRDLSANMPETVKEVKESIAIAFENVYGFLMPPAEREVHRKKISSEITIADIKGEFCDYACQLTEKILHPKNLVAKHLCGKPMSTNTCLGLIAEISKAFDLPSVDRMIDCYDKAEDVADFIKAVEMYEQHMNEHISKLGNIFSEKDVMVCHDNSLQDVKKLFSQKTATGFEEERSEIWKLIKEECENYSNSVIEENKQKKVHFQREECEEDISDKLKNTHLSERVEYFQISKRRTASQSQQRCSDDEMNSGDATKPFSEQPGTTKKNISTFSEGTTYEVKAEVEYVPSALQEYNVESAIEPYAFRVDKKGCRVIAPYCKLLFPPNAVERAIDITMSVMYYSEKEVEGYAFITPHVEFTSSNEIKFLRYVQVSLYTSYSFAEVEDPVYVEILKTSKSEDDVILTQVCLTDERFIVFGCRSFCRFSARVRDRDQRLMQRRFYSAAYIRNERTKQSRVVHWSIYEDMPDTRQDKLKHLEKKSIFFDPQCFTLRCHHDLQIKLKRHAADVTVTSDDENILPSHLFGKKVDKTLQFLVHLSEGVRLHDENLKFQTETVAIDRDTNATIPIDRSSCFMIWNDDKCSSADQHNYNINVGENGIGVKNDFKVAGSSVDP